jgi:hypothetical protein
VTPSTWIVARVTVSRFALLLAVAGLLFSGCDSSARRQAQARMDALNAQSDRIQQTLSDQQSELAGMMQRLTAQRGQLDSYNAEVQGYILDHKMAVAAIAAGVGGTARGQQQ